MNYLMFIICIPTIVLLIVKIVIDEVTIKKTINLERLEKDVQHKLEEEGIGWKKEDGEMYIVKKGERFDTYFRTVEGRSSARVFFVYRKADEGLKPINGWGQLMMADQMNGNHVGFTTIIRNDYLQSICYADVRNAKECVDELNHAYDQLSELMGDYEQLKPKILHDFPVKDEDKENSIGFA